MLSSQPLCRAVPTSGTSTTTLSSSRVPRIQTKIPFSLINLLLCFFLIGHNVKKYTVLPKLLCLLSSSIIVR